MSSKVHEILGDITRLHYLALFIFLILSSETSADFLSSSVGTNSSTWSIYRQSQNISFDLSGSVEGRISPVDFHGRSLNPYHSYYAELKANDVWLRERTSAKEGVYKSQETTRLQAATEGGIVVGLIKPAGSNIYTVSYIELWPASLRSDKLMEYSGRGINERDFEGNNFDYSGSNLLYNFELFKDRRTAMWLKRMNATVRATDDAILSAEFEPTNYLWHFTKIHTTGIADFKYKQTGSTAYPPRTTDYSALIRGHERYYGDFYLGRLVTMKSEYDNFNESDNWRPCCL